MDFLKFLKGKGKAKIADGELDVPPAPPSIGGEDFALEPAGEALPDLPELPELPQIEEEQEDIFKAPRIELRDDSDLGIPFAAPEKYEPEIPEKPVSEEIRPYAEAKHKESPAKPIYIQFSRYRQVLEDIELIKGNFNNFERMSLRLGEIKDEKEKRFAKWNDQFKDIQKKLLFIDKALFAK